MKKILSLAATMAATAAYAAPYHVTAPMADDAEGAMVYLVNYDTGAGIDSVLVADGVAEFRGTIDEPVLARLLLDGERYATFILEEGGTAIDKDRNASGSMLNDRLNQIGDSASALAMRFRTAPDEATQQKIYETYEALMQREMADNIDNPIGYYLFLQQAGALTDGAVLQANIVQYIHIRSPLKQLYRKSIPGILKNTMGRAGLI